MWLKINPKRQEYTKKISSFEMDLRKLANKHNLTEFDLDCICSEILYKSLNKKIKNKVWKVYK